MSATVHFHRVTTVTAQALTTSNGDDASTLKLNNGTTEINIFMPLKQAEAMAAAFAAHGKTVAA